MTRPVISTFLVMATTLSAGHPVPLRAQPARMASHANAISVHVSLAKSKYVVGEKPFAALAIKNMSSEGVWFSTALYLVRIHVTRDASEAPKTEVYRHLLGDFRSGDGPELLSGPVAGRTIPSGSVDSQEYDLTYFYDLSKPGDYSVSIDIYDPVGPQDGSGRWLHTNTAYFKIEAPAS